MIRQVFDKCCKYSFDRLCKWTQRRKKMLMSLGSISWATFTRSRAWARCWPLRVKLLFLLPLLVCASVLAMHTCTHACIHASCIHTHIHTYMHTFTFNPCPSHTHACTQTHAQTGAVLPTAGEVNIPQLSALLQDGTSR